MIVTARRLGGVGDAMAGMVGSVFRMIVWLVGRLKSIRWWGGGGGGKGRWVMRTRILLEDCAVGNW